MRSLLLASFLAAALTAQTDSAKGDANKTIAEFTAGMQQLEGFVDLFVDPSKDRIYLHLSAFDADLLYATAHASGLGSNPIGLDRGSLGPQHVIAFHRAGPKVLVLAKNLKFRALSDNPRERAAVAESFAPSVIASLPVKAEEAGAVVVDATAFFLRDATGTERRLSRDSASYKLDKDRSALWLDRTKAFPDNTEVETLLTFTSSRAAGEVRRTAADGEAVTLRQHHSFIRLPDENYTPRPFDPRVGYFGPQFQDYAAPLGESMHHHYIARHRLQKKDPSAAVSEPVEPIVYYIDPGTPEPVRSALIEGAMWWDEAFEAAGFKNAFKVEMLPLDADPMDVRYHMIHWVHRQTRGWSYGSSIRDPRTGEIIKGNVLLGSLRVRQDILKFVGLRSPFSDDGGACAAGMSPDAGYLIRDDDVAKETALARIRQLSAHEVGHTLGLSHNFAASTYGRASVMDYPAPLVLVDGAGRLDFSQAYDTGIGEYDVFAIVYGYAQFADGADEDVELDRIVRDGLAKGFAFLTDQDARSAGTSHPLASLWDNGTDPLSQFEHELRVRAIGLRRFGIDALRPGQTLASLEDTLVPLYLHHRFQLDAVMKLIGGVDFRHAVKGDGQLTTEPVPPHRQRRALELALRTLQPEFLQLDPRALRMIPPAPPGHPGTAERFPRKTGQLLDPIAMATVAAELTVGGLLNPQRAARLELPTEDIALTLDEVLRELERAAFHGECTRDQRPLVQAVRDVVIDRLMRLADDGSASATVRTRAEESLRRISVFAAAGDSARQRVRAFLDNPNREQRRAPNLEPPPGSPIGSGR